MKLLYNKLLEEEEEALAMGFMFILKSMKFENMYDTSSLNDSKNLGILMKSRCLGDLNIIKGSRSFKFIIARNPPIS
jgi:hypothetical protein